MKNKSQPINNCTERVDTKKSKQTADRNISIKIPTATKSDRDNDCTEYANNIDSNLIIPNIWSQWFANVLNESVWKCFNCDKHDNCLNKNSKCVNCNIGVHPFYFFIKNKRDPNQLATHDYSILTKQFGLVAGFTFCLAQNKVCDTFSCFVAAVFVSLSFWFR